MTLSIEWEIAGMEWENRSSPFLMHCIIWDKRYVATCDDATHSNKLIINQLLYEASIYTVNPPNNDYDDDQWMQTLNSHLVIAIKTGKTAANFIRIVLIEYVGIRGRTHSSWSSHSADTLSHTHTTNCIRIVDNLGIVLYSPKLVFDFAAPHNCQWNDSFGIRKPFDVRV